MSEKTLVRSSHEQTKSIASRRRLAAVALGAGALIGIGAHPVEQAVSSFAQSIHEVGEYNDYSGRYADVSKKITENHTDPASLLFTTVKPGAANPTEVAQYLHAKDVPALANTIASQVGGDRNMNSGDQLVIPLDLLKPPTQE